MKRSTDIEFFSATLQEEARQFIDGLELPEDCDFDIFLGCVQHLALEYIERAKSESADLDFELLKGGDLDSPAKLNPGQLKIFLQCKRLLPPSVVAVLISDYLTAKYSAEDRENCHDLEFLIFLAGMFWGQFDKDSNETEEYNQIIAKIVKSETFGKGGRSKAKCERKEKLRLIKPLLDELKKVRLSGKYKSCERAVKDLLYGGKYDELLEKVDPSDGGQHFISFKYFLMVEAKKVWENCIKMSA